MTQDECRKAVCFFCFSKGTQRLPIRPSLSEGLVDFITRGIFPDFHSKKQFLPTGVCSVYRSRVARFMKIESEEPDVFVYKVHDSRYVSVSSELENLAPDKKRLFLHSLFYCEK